MKMILVLVLLVVPMLSARAEPSEAHIALASELLRHLDLERTMLGGPEALADAMIQENAAMSPYRNVLVEWAARYVTWKSFEGKLARLYADSFSEPEIRELIAFYESPVGQKVVQLGPELMRRGALLGAEVAAEHASELTEMIKARAAELDAVGDPKS